MLSQQVRSPDKESRFLLKGASRAEKRTFWKEVIESWEGSSETAAQLIPKSYATTSLLAELLVGKFADAIPYYRQEKQFARDGVRLQRTTTCNCTRKVASRAGPIMDWLR